MAVRVLAAAIEGAVFMAAAVVRAPVRGVPAPVPARGAAVPDVPKRILHTLTPMIQRNHTARQV